MPATACFPWRRRPAGAWWSGASWRRAGRAGGARRGGAAGDRSATGRLCALPGNRIDPARHPAPPAARMRDRFMTDTEISPLDKARILSEALPHMQEYDEETIVIKYGGHAMGD